MPENQVAVVEHPELVALSKQDVVISDMAAQYMQLTVRDHTDVPALERVHAAWMHVKNTRIAIEATRVRLKADALAYGQAVDGEANRLKLMLAPIVAHLAEQKACVAREKARRDKEASDIYAAKVKFRIDTLQVLGQVGNPLTLGDATEDEFTAMMNSAKQEKDLRDAAEVARVDAQKAEDARLAVEKIRQDAFEVEIVLQRRALEEQRLEQQRDLDAQRAAALVELNKLNAERAEVKRLADLEQARKDAAEAERKRLEKEKQDAFNVLETKRLEAERVAAMRPYKAKVLGFADTLGKLTVPDGPLVTQLESVMEDTILAIQALAAGL